MFKKRPRDDAMLEEHASEVENAIKRAGEAEQAAVAGEAATQHALEVEKVALAREEAAIAAETAAKEDCMVAIAAARVAVKATAEKVAAEKECAAALAAARVAVKAAEKAAANNPEGKSKKQQRVLMWHCPSCQRMNQEGKNCNTCSWLAPENGSKFLPTFY